MSKTAKDYSNFDNHNDYHRKNNIIINFHIAVEILFIKLLIKIDLFGVKC